MQPCVYIRWALYKLKKTDSLAYVINGIAMLLAFFLTRNVLGTGAPCHAGGNRCENVINCDCSSVDRRSRVRPCSNVGGFLPRFCNGTCTATARRHLAGADLGLSDCKRPAQLPERLLVSEPAVCMQAHLIATARIFATRHQVKYHIQRRVYKMASGAAKLLRKRQPVTRTDDVRKAQ